MSHNHNYEPMPAWVAWAGVGLMMFTVIIFVVFTLSVMYFGCHGTLIRFWICIAVDYGNGSNLSRQET